MDSPSGFPLSLFPSVCPMGSNSSSNSRFFGTLAQSLTSTPLEQREEYLEKNPGQDQALDPDLIETDPELLLRECEEALQRRPARPHRDLVYLNCMAPCRRKHSPSIRIMQWNILAQGKHFYLKFSCVVVRFLLWVQFLAKDWRNATYC